MSDPRTPDRQERKPHLRGAAAGRGCGTAALRHLDEPSRRPAGRRGDRRDPALEGPRSFPQAADRRRWPPSMSRDDVDRPERVEAADALADPSRTIAHGEQGGQAADRVRRRAALPGIQVRPRLARLVAGGCKRLMVIPPRVMAAGRPAAAAALIAGGQHGVVEGRNGGHSLRSSVARSRHGEPRRATRGPERRYVFAAPSRPARCADEQHGGGSRRARIVQHRREHGEPHGWTFARDGRPRRWRSRPARPPGLGQRQPGARHLEGEPLPQPPWPNAGKTRRRRRDGAATRPVVLAAGPKGNPAGRPAPDGAATQSPARTRPEARCRMLG